MSKSIRLHLSGGDQGAQRLNPFPGRNLSEHAFDLMQAYVDQRVEPLLANGLIGIVEGLDLTTHNAGRKLQMHVQPGAAIAGDGRAIRVFFPIELDWEALIDAHRQANQETEIALDGFYYLTVRRMVGRVEDAPGTRPCTRDELDPLRDSRIETYATLDLQYITNLGSLRKMSQRRAVNRLCVRALNTQIFDHETGAVPLAYVFIDKGIPRWVDTIGGRYLAQKNAPYHAFAAHWESVIAATEDSSSLKLAEMRATRPGSLFSSRRSLPFSGVDVASPDLLSDSRLISLSETERRTDIRLAGREDGPSLVEADSLDGHKLPDTLSHTLGVDYVPAAGRFPEYLLGNIAGNEIDVVDEETGKPRKAWALPEILFEPRDLQIEILPVPASSALGVIRRELPRGAIDLVHRQGDRLRLMVSVEDEQYRADLMNLPAVDEDLLEALYERAQTAMESEHEWAAKHRELYYLLDEAPVDETGELSEEVRLQFKSTYLVPAYSTTCEPGDDSEPSYDDYPNLSEVQRKELGVPKPVCPVRIPDRFFEDLRASGKTRPYTNTDPSPPESYEEPKYTAPEDSGLYRQSYMLASHISRLEEDLEDNHGLIDEINDFLSVQRQHLDSITTNFAALAGGVAGDGSGLRLMRWNSTLRYQPKAGDKNSESGGNT